MFFSVEIPNVQFAQAVNIRKNISINYCAKDLNVASALECRKWHFRVPKFQNFPGQHYDKISLQKVDHRWLSHRYYSFMILT